LGEHTISTEKDCFDENHCAEPVQKISVTRDDLIVHPEYNHLKVLNDIALIRLSEPAKIHQKNIQAVCLPINNEFEKIPNKMFVIGFGYTENSMRFSDVLRKVLVSRVSDEECSAIYNSTLNFDDLTDRRFCAGSKLGFFFATY
jgi:secreted trypsin-like serine protease